MGVIVAILGAVLIVVLVLRTAITALVLTGLSRDIARFQAHSAFFGVGFTTSEAETIVTHPTRRRIVGWLIIVGGVGLLGIVSSAVITLVKSGDDLGMQILTLAVGLLFVWGLTSNRWLDRGVNRLIERGLRRFTTLDARDYAAMLRLGGDYAVTTFTIREGGALDGVRLGDVRRDGGVVLLGLERRDGTYLGAPGADVHLAAGDQLTVYARDDVLTRLRQVPTP